MPDTQYELFQKLDRHCVARAMPDEDCHVVVAQKRASIIAESHNNPLVKDVLEGRTTFVAIYETYSRAFRGVRRFLPMAHDAERNRQLERFSRIVPNVQHFLRRSLIAADNPVMCTVYGIVVAFGLVTVWAYATRGDAADGNEIASTLEAGALARVVLLCAFGGFFAGLLATLKYRTRDPKIIHAREAAAYMDINYHCHRTCDDDAWVKFFALKTAPTSAAADTPPPVTTPNKRTASQNNAATT